MGTQHNEWEARKAVIKQRTYEVMQAEQHKEWDEFNKRHQLTNFVLGELLEAHNNFKKSQDEFEEMIIERAKWIASERARGRKMESQEIRLSTMHNFLKAAKKREQELTRIIAIDQDSHERHLQFLLTKIKGQSETMEHYEATAKIGKELLEMMQQ